jgi:hypothetical protein
MFTVSRVNKAFFTFGFNTIELHQLANPFFAYPEASGVEFFCHPRTTILLTYLGVYDPDLNQQSPIAQARKASNIIYSNTFLSSLVLEISTGTHAQNLTCQSNGPLSLIPINPGVFH